MGETDTLGRLFDKLDKLNERLARVEALVEERNERSRSQGKINDDFEQRIKSLEESKVALFGIKGFLAWLVVTAITIYGVMK